jgi:hypothetical protein
MAIGGYGNVGKSVSFSDTDTVTTIFNIVVVTPNVEVSQALPANTKSFSLRCRDNGTDMKLTFTSGESGTKYWMVRKQTVYEDNSFRSSGTIYFQISVAGTVELKCDV